MASNKRIQIISFLVALFLVFVLVAWILKPFVTILAFALIITILFHPLYKVLLKKIKSPSLSSLATVLIILAIIGIPIWLFGQLIFNEMQQLFEKYRAGALVIDKDQIVAGLPSQVQDIIQNVSRDLNDFVGRLSTGLFSSLSQVVSNVASFIIAFFMFFFIVYYLLKDGGKIKAMLMDLSPIASSQESKLFDRIVAAVNGVVKGSFLVALTQGVVATIGFYFFGVPEPLLWGAFTVVVALVPTVGTALSLIPAVIYLLVTNHVPQAIGMTIWGAVAVGLVDNFLGPKLIGNSTKLHPVLVLLAVIGGVQFFGVLGFLIGPIVMAIFVAMIEIYRGEFQEYLDNKAE